jgi:hypothetical protein
MSAARKRPNIARDGKARLPIPSKPGYAFKTKFGPSAPSPNFIRQSGGKETLASLAIAYESPLKGIGSDETPR